MSRFRQFTTEMLTAPGAPVGRSLTNARTVHRCASAQRGHFPDRALGQELFSFVFHPTSQNEYIQFGPIKNFHLATRRALTYASYAISETFRVTVTMGLRSVVRPDWLNSKRLSTTGSETSRSR